MKSKEDVNAARYRALLKASKKTGRKIVPEWRSLRLFVEWLEEEEWQIRTKVGKSACLFFTTKFAVFDPKDVPLGPDNCGLVTQDIAHQLRAGGKKTGLPLGVATDHSMRQKPYQALVVQGKTRYREWFSTAREAHSYWQKQKAVVLTNLMYRLKFDGWVPLFEKAIASLKEDLRLERETTLEHRGL